MQYCGQFRNISLTDAYRATVLPGASISYLDSSITELDAIQPVPHSFPPRPENIFLLLLLPILKRFARSNRPFRSSCGARCADISSKYTVLLSPLGLFLQLIVYGFLQFIVDFLSNEIRIKHILRYLNI